MAPRASQPHCLVRCPHPARVTGCVALRAGIVGSSLLDTMGFGKTVLLNPFGFVFCLDLDILHLIPFKMLSYKKCWPGVDITFQENI